MPYALKTGFDTFKSPINLSQFDITLNSIDGFNSWATKKYDKTGRIYQNHQKLQHVCPLKQANCTANSQNSSYGIFVEASQFTIV